MTHWVPGPYHVLVFCDYVVQMRKWATVKQLFDLRIPTVSDSSRCMCISTCCRCTLTQERNCTCMLCRECFGEDTWLKMCVQTNRFRKQQPSIVLCSDFLSQVCTNTFVMSDSESQSIQDQLFNQTGSTSWSNRHPGHILSGKLHRAAAIETAQNMKLMYEQSFHTCRVWLTVSLVMIWYKNY